MIERSFKGIWIPAEIWLNKDLSLMEKIFLVEIDSLDNETGCYASNKHFSVFFDVSSGRCSQIIKNLEEKGFISIEYEKEGNRILKRTIKVVNKLNHLFRKLNDPIKFSKPPYLENDEGNNTSINNTKRERESPLAFLEINAPITYESLLMKYRSQIKDFDYALEQANLKIITEELNWTSDVLFARFQSFLNSWIRNSKKYATEEEQINNSTNQNQMFYG